MMETKDLWGIFIKGKEADGPCITVDVHHLADPMRKALAESSCLDIEDTYVQRLEPVPPLKPRKQDPAQWALCYHDILLKECLGCQKKMRENLLMVKLTGPGKCSACETVVAALLDGKCPICAVTGQMFRYAKRCEVCGAVEGAPHLERLHADVMP